jgi:hypothetical protein
LTAWIAEHLKVDSEVIDGKSPVSMVTDGRYFETCYSGEVSASFAHPERQRAVTVTAYWTQGDAEELLRQKRSRILYLDHVESD